MPHKPSPLRRPRATVLTLTAIVASALGIALSFTACQAVSAPIDTVGRVAFDNALAIPPLAPATVDSQGKRTFDLTAQTGNTQIRPGRTTATWGYNGGYLGPTIVAKRGDEVVVNVHNELPEATTLHWHGMHLPARADGGPHSPILPTESASPSWRIDQPASTGWYHPHPHEQTEEQVGKGLAGLVILQDDAEAALPLPRAYGVDDIPVMVQDVHFDADNQLSDGTRGFVGALGDTVLVNGTQGPYENVTTTVVRLRLLDASVARIYNFGFSDHRSFALIGTDGGLLEKPFETDHVQLSPGERAEVLVRMAPGETVTLRSTAPNLGVDGIPAANSGGRDSFDVLQLRAASTLTTVGTVPESLVPMQRLVESAAVVHRQFTLDGTQIDGRTMDLNRIDTVVTVDTTEEWTIRNDMDMPHSFHVHDVQFQVQSIGNAPPDAELAGWKDTIYLRPNTDYRILIHFSDYADPSYPYMYHCHLLFHEDQGMMGQFVVVNPGQLPSAPPPMPSADATMTGGGMAHDHH